MVYTKTIRQLALVFNSAAPRSSGVVAGGAMALPATVFKGGAKRECRKIRFTVKNLVKNFKSALQAYLNTFCAIYNLDAFRCADELYNFA